MSEVPQPSGNWYSGQPYNQSNWDTQETSLDNILDNGYLIVSGNTTLANLSVSGATNLASLNFTGSLDLNNSNITTLANGTNSQDAVNKSQLDTKLSLSGGTMTGVIDFNNNNIYNLFNIVNTTAFRVTIGTSPQGIVEFRSTYTEFAKFLYMNVGGAGNTGIDMVNSNIVNGGSINATAIAGTSLTLSLPITQNAVGSVYSTTLNGSTSQIGGYNFLVGTAIDLFTPTSGTNVNLLIFTLPAGIWNASATMNITNTTPNTITAVISRLRYGFNTGASSIVTPYANTSIKQDIRSLSIPATGANVQFYNFNEILINATGANITLYFNANIVWTGPTSTGFTATCANLNLVRIA